MSLDLPDSLISLINDKRVKKYDKRIKELEREIKDLNGKLNSVDNVISVTDKIFKCSMCNYYGYEVNSYDSDCSCNITLCKSCFKTNLYLTNCKNCMSLCCVACLQKCSVCDERYKNQEIAPAKIEDKYKSCFKC